MLRKLLILFFGLVFSVAGMSADKKISLHLEPKPNSKIIGAIKNTDVMVRLEEEDKWSKVVDGETGLIGWVMVDSLPAINKSSNASDKTSIH